MFVSIVLPTYNRAALLPRAIDSVIRQSHREWELIVVDDGSTDDTISIVERYAHVEPRIQIITQEHRGVAVARNSGIARSAGHWITYLDSDDEYGVEHLTLRVQFLTAHPDVAFIHGGIEIIGSEEQNYVVDVHDSSKRIHIRDCVVGGTFFGIKEVFTLSGGWREGYSEDSELFERIAARYRTARVDFPTYIYHRDSPDSRCDDAAR